MFYVIHADGEWKLVLITNASSVGSLPQGGEVFCVDRISIIPLTTDTSKEIIGMQVSSCLVIIVSCVHLCYTTIMNRFDMHKTESIHITNG